jgi:hypothetical protein
MLRWLIIVGATGMWGRDVMTAVIDQNGDGRISFSEFVASTLPLSKKGPEDEEEDEELEQTSSKQEEQKEAKKEAVERGRRASVQLLQRLEEQAMETPTPVRGYCG